MSALRLILPFSLCFLPLATSAQLIEGVFQGPIPASHVVLYSTRGHGHHALDSVPIKADGRFRFPQRRLAPGFYQLGVNDTDRVDIIVDHRERRLQLAFNGTPLQRHLDVRRSAENQRMWAYKLISRDAQADLEDVRARRALAAPLDTALLRGLERRDAAIRQRMLRGLDSLTALAPQGAFARAVRQDRSLDALAGEPPASIRKAFDFSSPQLLRSSAYSKAILLSLQGTPFTTEQALHRTCDTLLSAAAADTSCWSYMREHLIELFVTYGPDDLAQYLVEEYVVGPRALVPPSPSLLAMASEQLRLVPGAEGPDIDLVSPDGTATVRLSGMVAQHAYTVLFFYSSTCDHCHAQMPGLRQLVLDMEPSLLGVIGIALDGTLEEFQNTLAQERINWPCYSELNGWGARSAKAYHVKATPTFIVLDRHGIIRAKPMDHLALRAFLEGR